MLTADREHKREREEGAMKKKKINKGKGERLQVVFSETSRQQGAHRITQLNTNVWWMNTCQYWSQH